jgi:uncharacterized protein YdhG (YjbR/CyaY superfamily)
MPPGPPPTMQQSADVVVVMVIEPHTRADGRPGREHKYPLGYSVRLRRKMSQDVETFLAAVPEQQRVALEKLRQTIKSIVPNATESVSYGVPAFKYRDRPLVSYGAAKSHCSFYVQSPAVMDAHKADLVGFNTVKGTVHFAPDRPLPDDLVRKLVLARMAETDALPRRGR